MQSTHRGFVVITYDWRGPTCVERVGIANGRASAVALMERMLSSGASMVGVNRVNVARFLDGGQASLSVYDGKLTIIAEIRPVTES